MLGLFERMLFHSLEYFFSFNIPFRESIKWDINIFNEEVEKAATFQVKIV